MAIKRALLILSLFCFFGAFGFSQSPSSDDLSEGAITVYPQEAGGTASNEAPSGEVVPTYSAPVEGEPSFRLSDNDSNLLFYQRLTWESAQYAISYHVVLERKRDTLDTYTEVLRKNVDEPFLDISVPFGEYRYRVLGFNILGLLDSQSDWEYFIVLQAHQPTIVEFLPNAFYFDRLTPRIITLLGENLLPDSEIFLVSRTQLDESGNPLVLKPIEIHRNELGESARLIFAEEDLVLGSYEIVVKNPGGLETRAEFFRIAMAKPFDINVSGGYTPKIALFGQKEDFLDKVFTPLGFSFRGSFIPLKRNNINFGVEIGASWSFIVSNNDEFITRKNLVIANAGALFQYRIMRNTLFANARAGAGFAGIFNYYFEYDTGKRSESKNFAAFTYNVGASVQWFFFKQIFMEGGLDYIHVIHKEIPMGFIQLGLFLGYQF